MSSYSVTVGEEQRRGCFFRGSVAPTSKIRLRLILGWSQDFCDGAVFKLITNNILEYCGLIKSRAVSKKPFELQCIFLVSVDGTKGIFANMILTKSIDSFSACDLGFSHTRATQRVPAVYGRCEAENAHRGHRKKRLSLTFLYCQMADRRINQTRRLKRDVTRSRATWHRKWVEAAGHSRY